MNLSPLGGFAFAALIGLLWYATRAVCGMVGDRRGPSADKVEAIRWSAAIATSLLVVSASLDLVTGETVYRSIRDLWSLATLAICVHAMLAIRVLKGNKNPKQGAGNVR